VQAARFLVGEQPLPEVVEKCTQDLLADTSEIVLPYLFTQEYSRAAARTHLMALLQYIKRDASPGVPLSLLAQSNGQVIDLLGMELVEATLDRIESLCHPNLFKDNGMTAFDAVEFDLCDPIRLFIKNEPHLKSKIDEGRLRLIMSVSLMDKLVEMFFFQHQNKAEIAEWYKIPFKPGMGFTSEMNSSVYDRLAKQDFKTLAAADISGWDWSVKDHNLYWDVEYRLRRQNPAKSWYNFGARNRTFCMANSLFQLSNGELYIHPPGIMPSGTSLTSSSNSHMRSFVARNVQLMDLTLEQIASAPRTFADANGDDCIERKTVNAIDKYTRLGFRCKMYEDIRDSFEFCSHIYTLSGAYPLNIIKETMNLLHHHELDADSLRAYTLAYEDDLVFNPEFAKIQSILYGMGWYAKINC
jgi:hypothetical protein